MTSRYTSATSTGLGSVFVIKLIKFWMEGRILMFPNSGGAVLKANEELSWCSDEWDSLCRGRVCE